MTTHDTDLAQIAGTIPTVENIHFEHVLIDGQMGCDDRLRSGIVPKGNGLELMRSMGLMI